MLAQVAVRFSGPAQIVSTTSVVVNAAIAATVKRPKRMPSLLRAFWVSVSPSRLDTRVIDVLGELADGAAPVAGRPRGGGGRQLRPQALRRRTRGRVPGADRAAADPDRGVAGADRLHDRHVHR